MIVLKKSFINTTELIKGILIIFLYFFIASIISIPFSFLLEKSIISYSTANLLLYLFISIFFSLIYIKDLIKDFKSFKKDYKNILKITLSFWIKGVFIMLLSSLIINLFSIDINANQAANIEQLKEMPIVEIICATIFAPIIEELVFRRGLKNFTSNKHIYALSSGIIFGFLHVMSSLSGINSLIMLVYLIPYSALGIAFAYAYEKTDNIYGVMLIHGLHNAISLLEIIILGGLL